MGRSGLVRGARGHALVRFRDEGPGAGTEVLLWSEPDELGPPLPGEWSLEGIRIRAKAEHRLARDWIPVGGVRPDPVLPSSRHQGLIGGLLLGQSQGVDTDTEALLRRTGTRHLLAVSGLHTRGMSLSMKSILRITKTQSQRV